jgi:hypothetical protein
MTVLSPPFLMEVILEELRYLCTQSSIDRPLFRRTAKRLVAEVARQIAEVAEAEDSTAASAIAVALVDAKICANVCLAWGEGLSKPLDLTPIDWIDMALCAVRWITGNRSGR